MGERYLSRSRGRLIRWIMVSLERAKRKACFQKEKVEKIKVSKKNRAFSLEAWEKNLNGSYRCENHQHPDDM